ncbi:hypothetical protein D3C76_775890 [compost metagenome]
MDHAPFKPPLQRGFAGNCLQFPSACHVTDRSDPEHYRDPPGAGIAGGQPSVG